MQRIAQFEKVSIKEYEKSNPPVTDAKAAYNGIKLPVRATKSSAGYDFFAPYGIVLAPGETATVSTGIRVKIEDGWVLQIYPRSGLGFKYRLQLDNSVGIIDADYYNSDNEGHIFIRITNCTTAGKTVEIKRGDAFAQGIFVQFGITEDDCVTAERNGGLGSTSAKGEENE